MDSKRLASPRVRDHGTSVLLFALLLLLVVVYADPLTTRRNFVGRDLVPYGLPLEKSVHDAWSRGRLPVWSDTISGGRPLFPNPNAGVLYPLRPLLARLPFPAAMRLFPVLHWLIAGAGVVLLLRALRASAAAAWVAAVTYAFSGVVVSQFMYLPLLPGTALQPWVLFALARPARTLGSRAVGVALVWGVLLVGGDAFAVAAALLSSLLWIALGVGPERRRAQAGGLAVGVSLGALLAAPQIAATVLVAPETQRAITGLLLREALAFSLPPWRLLELAIPYPFGDAWTLDPRETWSAGAFRGFFVTLHAGAFALVALAAIWRDSDPRARFARALFVCGTALAVVFWFVPSAWGTRGSWIPLRFPEKFAVATTLSLAVAAGLAFDRLRIAGRPPRWVLGAAAVLAALAVATRLAPDAAGDAAARAIGAPAGAAPSAARQLPAALAEAGILWALTAAAISLLRDARRSAAGASLVLLTAVPILASRPIAQTEGEGSVFPPTAFARATARRDPDGSFRTIDLSPYRPASAFAAAAAMRGDPWATEAERQDWSWASPTLWRRGTVFNLDPDRGDLYRLESLRRFSGGPARAADGNPFFSTVGLRFAIRYRGEPPLPGFRRFGGDPFRDWDENPAALPDVRLLERWREAPDAVAAFEAVRGLAPGDVVIETGRRGAGAARAGAIRIVEKSPERLVVDADAPDPTWLFVLRDHWPHRAIRRDGEGVRDAPAQLAFSAVEIPAGRHRVEWIENVPGLTVSRWGPAIFALAAGGLLAPRAALRA